MPTKDYQTDLLKRLAHGEYAAQYLKAAFDETLVDGNKSAFLLALKNVVEATGAMQTVVNEAHISRQHYKKYDNIPFWKRTKKNQKLKSKGFFGSFEKEEDELVGEKVIPNFNLEHLQKLFGIDLGNPMYDCYLVEFTEQINYLQNLLDFELDTKSYDYFIECDRR